MPTESIGAISKADPFLQGIAKLRANAWGDGKTMDFSAWLAEWDAVAHHHIILRNGQLAAAFRFTVHDRLDDLPYRSLFADILNHLPSPVAFSSRLVVGREWSGRGLSKMLDQMAITSPKMAGARSVVATGSSVSTTEKRDLLMLRYGWTLAGKAAAMPVGPIPSDHPPKVYYVIY